MNMRLPFIAFLVLAVVSAPAVAQKMYKWTDAEGNVHYSDSVPPEHIDEPRDEFNKHGRVVEHTERALTPEEIKAKEAAEEVARIEELRKEQQLADDRKLLTVYAAEGDIIRTRDQQASVIERSIVAGQAIVTGQTKSLAGLMERAAQLEGQGQVVSEALQTSIKEMQRQINVQKGYVRRMEQEKADTIKRFDAELERYRDVKKRWGLDTENSG
jgi:hypothetical protein